jgi:hypothetical protein
MTEPEKGDRMLYAGYRHPKCIQSGVDGLDYLGGESCGGGYELRQPVNVRLGLVDLGDQASDGCGKWGDLHILEHHGKIPGCNCRVAADCSEKSYTCINYAGSSLALIMQ